MDIYEKEIKEVFSQLRSAGYNPELCDTPVTYFKENPVQCGNPNMVGDVVGEDILLPRSLWAYGLTFRIRATGDSMKGADIMDGDDLTIMSGSQYKEGDIVLASIDGNYLLKAYYEDSLGRKWLLPKNEKYKGILLTEDMDVKIMGRVIEVARKDPHVSMRDCEKIVRATLDDEQVPTRLTEEQLKEIIIKIAPMVKKKRQWYAVFRPLVDKEYEKRGIYEGFCAKVAQWVPGHKNLPTASSLQRMAVMSFDKPVKLWDKNDAPVTGITFDYYQHIAELMLEKLKV